MKCNSVFEKGKINFQDHQTSINREKYREGKMKRN